MGCHVIDGEKCKAVIDRLIKRKSTMLTTKEVINFWADKFGLSKEGKTAKKRMTIRAAKKAQRQERYGEKVGWKAIREQRRKRKQLKQVAEGR